MLLCYIIPISWVDWQEQDKISDICIETVTGLTWCLHISDINHLKTLYFAIKDNLAGVRRPQTDPYEEVEKIYKQTPTP